LNVLLNEAERHVDPGTAAMLVNVGPILIAVLAGLLLGEGFPRRLLVGCLVAFGGAIVIGAATSRGGLDAGWGAVPCLGAAATYAPALAFAGGAVCLAGVAVTRRARLPRWAGRALPTSLRASLWSTRVDVKRGA
jgi:drug/metabolite transporter (DMT)-like permease